MSLFSRWFRWAAATLALTSVANGAEAQPITPDKAPAAWVDYARTATQTISVWLNGADPDVSNLRLAFAMAQPASAKPQPALLTIKVWVDPAGAVSQVQGGALLQPDVEHGLQTLLTGRQLPGPPPADMRQPMHLSLTLKPPAPPDAPAPAAP